MYFVLDFTLTNPLGCQTRLEHMLLVAKIVKIRDPIKTEIEILGRSKPRQMIIIGIGQKQDKVIISNAIKPEIRDTS